MTLANFETEFVDRVLVARIQGELDMSNAHDIGDAISDRMSNEALGLVLDLATVEYMDSAAIHMVFELRAGLKTRGQELRLVVPPGAPIEDALRIVDVPAAIGTWESSEAARTSIPGARS